MSCTKAMKAICKIAILATVYTIAGKFGLLLASLSPSVSAVWPPSGIAVAALVLWGWQLWPAVFLGAFVVNITTAGTVWTSLGIACGNTLEALLASFLMNQFCAGKRAFERTSDIFKFTLLAGLVSPLVSATMGLASLSLGGFAPWDQFSAIWLTWWLGDVVGILGVTSLIVLWIHPPDFSWNWRHGLEALLFIFLMFSTGQMVFGNWVFDIHSHYPLSFAFIPFMILAGLRFSPRECVTLIFLLCIQAIYGTLSGFGPFVRATTNESLVLLQSFVGTMLAAVLSLGATVAERRTAVNELKRVQNDLQQRIQELKQAEEKFRLSVEAAPNAMVMADETGRIVMLNSEAEKLFGYQREELLGKPVEILIPEHLREKHVSLRNTFVENPQTRAMGVGRELFGRRKDGTQVPVEIGLNPIHMDSQVYVLAAIIDITQRKRMDEMKSEFVSTVSHELKTPLTSIQGSLDLIVRAGTKVPAEIQKLIQIASRNSLRLVRIVNDILDIQKIEAGKITFLMKPVVFSCLVEQAVESIQLYAQSSDVKIEIGSLVSQVRIQGDPDRLMQVLDNLISNAVKFSPSAGTVKIDMTRLGQMVRVSIRGQGPGISEEFRNHLFQKFSQVHTAAEHRGGTGLGLWITKSILEHHGGKIDFESMASGETIFFFDLPIFDEGVLETPMVEAKTGLRALVCEDEDDVSTLLGLILKEAGFLIEVAHTAQQAKSFLSHQHFDVMTLDLALPDQDGISLVRELRKEEGTQQLPIVVVSAKAHQTFKETRHDALGIVEWIEKPIHPDHFVSSVRQAAMMQR